MKTRTKLLTAVLSTVTALSCALTAAASGTTPTITLQGNETAPISLENGTASQAILVLKATDFSTVAGADITLTLPESGKVKLTEAEVADSLNNWTLTENENYKIDLTKGIIKFVDVFNVTTSEINSLELKLTFTVSDGTIGSHKIGIIADLATDENTLLGDGEKTVTEGYIVIGKKTTPYTADDIANINSSVDVETEFIPYGGAYTKNADGTYTYYEKNTSTGEFEFGTATEVTVFKCKLPTGGKKVTSFGASDKQGDTTKYSSDDYRYYDGIQFGAYAIDKSLTYGTLVIMGDYKAFKEYYSNKTDEELFNTMMSRYNSKVSSGTIDEGGALSFPYGTGEDRPIITIKRVNRTKYMWDGASTLQYALRLYKLVNNKSYTAVAYSKDAENAYSFSTEILTEVYTASSNS